MRLPPIPETIKDPELARYLRDLSQALREGFSERPTPDQVIGQMYLLSPSRKTYRITVDDAGNLVMTQVGTSG